jgi:hypothetical protein
LRRSPASALQYLLERAGLVAGHPCVEDLLEHTVKLAAEHQLPLGEEQQQTIARLSSSPAVLVALRQHSGCRDPLRKAAALLLAQKDYP